MSWLLLALGVFAFVSALNALIPFQRAWRHLLAPSYMLQLYASELVPLHLVLNSVLVAVLVYFGALAHWSGWVGLGFAAAALALYGLVARRARQSTGAVLSQAFEGLALTPLPVLSRLQPLALVSGPWSRAGFSYGPSRRNRLDVYKPSHSSGPAPVLVYVHGGAWVMGSKRQQGRHLIEHFVRHGWVCVSINYRLSPRVKWPEHLHDCKRALAWVHEHIAEHGGDPSRIVVAGGSAGAQLAAMLALTPNRADLQPGFESADTSVRACLAYYGPFDVAQLFNGHRGMLVNARLARRIFGTVPWESAEPFERASPLKLVHPGAPPFLVVHGTHDLMVPLEQSRAFADAMRAAHAQVVHVELPGAIHAFDVFRSWRTGLVAQASLAFAEGAVSLPTQVARLS